MNSLENISPLPPRVIKESESVGKPRINMELGKSPIESDIKSIHSLSSNQK